MMGMFTKSQTVVANTVYKEMKLHLKEKDGNQHVIMINSFSKFLNQNFGCEDKYTNQIDTILTNMQNDGYEIIDIKVNSIMNQGLTGSMEGFHTVVIYK